MNGDLTLDEAAERLGVHYQTVYRWVRTARLPAVKVDGRYRISPDDLAEFNTDRLAPEPPPTPSTDRLERHGAAMTTALTAGDETAALRIARKLVDQGAPVTAVIESVLVPPLVEIGRRWHEGEFGVYVEHRASAIVERILGEMTPNPRGRRRGTAVVAALSGDRHALPTAMAAAALREDSWKVEHLGADMPIDDILEFLQATPADLVVISVTGSDASRATAEAERAQQLIEEEIGAPTLVGGPGHTLAELTAAARGAVGSG